MGEKRPSIKDVAAAAGVSIATVSNVFNRTKPVNQALVDQVTRAATTLRYMADRAASNLRSGRTRTIAVMVPDLTDTFFASIVSSLEMMAYKDGYDVVVASSQNDAMVERSRVRTLLSWKPAGIIAIPCSNILAPELVEASRTLPMVLVDRVATTGAIADTVTIDNRDAGRLAAKHLLELGHRNIVLAVSQLELAPISERAAGASDLIAQATGQRPAAVELGPHIAEGTRIFSGWLQRNPIPTAVIALTNVTTLGVLSAFADNKIDIPGKTSIVAFDDYAWMSARNTGLTAIRQPLAEMAEVAWARLLFRMGDDTREDIKPTILGASLVVRASVRDIAVKVPGMSKPPIDMERVEPVERVAGDKHVH